MIKTLKITSIAAVVIAAGVVIGLPVFGLKADTEKEKLIQSLSAADQFREKNITASDKGDKISPLVKQAKEFALRINPPPPPKPPGV